MQQRMAQHVGGLGQGRPGPQQVGMADRDRCFGQQPVATSPPNAPDPKRMATSARAGGRPCGAPASSLTIAIVGRTVRKPASRGVSHFDENAGGAAIVRGPPLLSNTESARRKLSKARATGGR